MELGSFVDSTYEQSEPQQIPYMVDVKITKDWKIFKNILLDVIISEWFFFTTGLWSFVNYINNSFLLMSSILWTIGLMVPLSHDV